MCLGNELDVPSYRAEQKIARCFSELFAYPLNFEEYGSERALIRGLAENLPTAEILVVTTPAEFYLDFKGFLSSAFNLKEKYLKSLQRLMVDNIPGITPDEIAYHSMLPVDADAILSADGYNSGYIVDTEEEMLIVLPLDDERIDYLLKDGVVPYLKDHLDLMQIRNADPLRGLERGISSPSGEVYAENLRKAPAEPPAPMIIGGDNTEKVLYDRALLQRTLLSLLDAGSQVAFAETKTMDFLHKMEETDPFQNRYVYTSYIEDKNGEKLERFAEKLAEGAKKEAGTKYGAAVTKVYAKHSEEGQVFSIAVAVTDGNNSHVTSVDAIPGETPPELIYRAIDVVNRLIYDNVVPEQVVREDEELLERMHKNELPESKGKVIDVSDLICAPATEQDEKKLKKRRMIVGGLYALSVAGSMIVSVAVNNIYGLL